MTYLFPEEFRAKTFEVRCRPTATGEGFEVLLTRGDRHTSSYKPTFFDAARYVHDKMLNFYNGATNEDECDFSTNLDVAEASRPDCENRHLELEAKAKK